MSICSHQVNWGMLWQVHTCSIVLLPLRLLRAPLCAAIAWYERKVSRDNGGQINKFHVLSPLRPKPIFILQIVK